ncbi:peptidase [Bordetella genomosp. 1]|uniref:Peptidase n=1 Tax=Bordetella genomosp. 1 TaxID=1395607 RepID=A0A261SQA6_9BORD|nr:EcsC family protein [Bordetella genomosp. 1]OZI39335.1 peptidase [Bordetella genomosp. 1]
MTLSIHDDPQDLAALKAAVARLESPSLTIRLSNLIGSPIEWAISKLPRAASSRIQDAVHAALHKSVSAALRTFNGKTGTVAPRNRSHGAAAALTGAAGGFFGLTGTLVELPFSTTIMMRSVADIARSEGFSLADPDIQRECVQVFAMGGNSKDDDAAESAYYALRTAFNEVAKETAKALAEVATKHSAGKVAAHFGSPKQAGTWLAKTIEVVAQRFGINITEKIAAQAAPVVGAVSGAAINALFISHYQDMARGHFTIKRLEQKYGEAAVRAAYQDVLARVAAD